MDRFGRRQNNVIGQQMVSQRKRTNIIALNIQNGCAQVNPDSRHSTQYTYIHIIIVFLTVTIAECVGQLLLVAGTCCDSGNVSAVPLCQICNSIRWEFGTDCLLRMKVISSSHRIPSPFKTVIHSSYRRQASRPWRHAYHSILCHHNTNTHQPCEFIVRTANAMAGAIWNVTSAIILVWFVGMTIYLSPRHVTSVFGQLWLCSHRWWQYNVNSRTWCMCNVWAMSMVAVMMRIRHEFPTDRSTTVRLMYICRILNRQASNCNQYYSDNALSQCHDKSAR